jgi:acyl-CoA carboxylase subunit beta
MEPIRSRVDPSAELYRANRAAMCAALDRLRAELKRSTEGGGPKYVERHLERGKLLPRDRIELLLDEGSYFLEIAPLAGIGMPGESPGAGVIGGIGLVCGRECLIIANEATLKGGATSEAGLWKNTRLAEITQQNLLPVIMCVESAGADLPVQSKIFVPGGRGFRDITRRSKARTPTISIVFGSSTAGGAYLPGMSDYVIMVKGRAQVFLAGPPLVKMATGELVDEESLGGAEMHSRISGLSDYLAEDEADAIRLAREIVSFYNFEKPGSPNAAEFDEPAYDPDELLGIASADLRIPFEARDVIARIVDGSKFAEFKPEYGPTLVCGFARIFGYPVAILANNGVLMSESRWPINRTSRFCFCRTLPDSWLARVSRKRESSVTGRS